MSAVAEAPDSTANAPAEAAPAVPDAPSAPAVYESFEFPYPEEKPPAVAEAPKPEEAAKPPDEAPAAPPEAAAPDPDDLSDDELERVLKHPKGQARVDQLVNNKYGNALQQARAEAQQARERVEAERAVAAEAEAYYKKLSDDDAFFDEQIARHTRPKVLRWMADYEEHTASKANAASPSAVDLQAVKDELTQGWNTAAISEFQAVAKAVLPFYGDLPNETRATIESAKFDPAGNWLVDSMTALATGVQKHIERMERAHKDAIEEARQAGKNEAIAAREQSSPVLVNGQPGSDPYEIMRRFGRNDPDVTRDQFNAARKAAGLDY